jgi:hypothetical protein
MSPIRSEPRYVGAQSIGSEGDLTFVDLTWNGGQIEQWVRFGYPVCEERIDHHRRRFGFAPGAVFGVNRWAANAYGTVLSRFDILQAAKPGTADANAALSAARRDLAALHPRLAQGRTRVAGDRRYRGARHRSGGCVTGLLATPAQSPGHRATGPSLYPSPAPRVAQAAEPRAMTARRTIVWATALSAHPDRPACQLPQWSPRVAVECQRERSCRALSPAPG